MLTVLAGGVYLYTAVSPFLSRLTDPASLTAVAPIAFEQYRHADDLELMLTRRYKAGSPAKRFAIDLEYSGATLQGEKTHATTTTYSYRKASVLTWVIRLDANASGKILNISVDAS